MGGRSKEARGGYAHSSDAFQTVGKLICTQQSKGQLQAPAPRVSPALTVLPMLDLEPR